MLLVKRLLLSCRGNVSCETLFFFFYTFPLPNTTRTRFEIVFSRSLLIGYFVLCFFALWKLSDYSAFIAMSFVPIGVPVRRTKTEESRTLRYYNRLKSLYARVTPAQKILGATWYARCEERIRAESREAQVPFLRGCAMFAALSPNCSFGTNLNAFKRLMAHAKGDALRMDGVGAGMLPRSVERATKILHGTRRKVSGPKVGNFYLNLTGDYSVVTVDRHMWQAVEDLSPCKSLGRPCRASIARATKMIATETGFEPAEMQAILWMRQRADHGHKPYKF